LVTGTRSRDRIKTDSAVPGVLIEHQPTGPSRAHWHVSESVVHHGSASYNHSHICAGRECGGCAQCGGEVVVVGHDDDSSRSAGSYGRLSALQASNCAEGVDLFFVGIAPVVTGAKSARMNYDDRSASRENGIAVCHVVLSRPRVGTECLHGLADGHEPCPLFPGSLECSNGVTRDVALTTRVDAHMSNRVAQRQLGAA
jgi:hypothetical protein